MKFRHRLLIAFGFVASVATSSPLLHRAWVPPKGSIPFVKLAGEPVPPTADLGAFVRERAEALLAVKKRVVLDGEASTVTEDSLAGLGLVVDVEATVAMLEAVGRDAPMLERVELAAKARRGEIDLPFVLTVDAARVKRWVEPLKVAQDKAPVEARLDLDKHGVVPEKDGRYVDLDGAVSALLHAARTPLVPSVLVPVRTFKPQVSGAKLAKVDIGTVIASYETRFGRGGKEARRARNIEVAASRVNGVMLQPGQIVSFNEIVGARSEENGFQKAGEIFRGEMIEGVGGGTCQVASTLHAAVMFGGLDILERLPHSRPSAYIPIGLDATVVYPAVDFKFRNPFPFPVVIHAEVSTHMLRVEVLGGQKPVLVSFSHSVVGSRPYTRKIVEDDYVEKPTTKQKGLKGVTIRRARVLEWKSGERRVETTVDTYPPTIEIYRVPRGFNPEELPPLPEESGSLEG